MSADGFERAATLLEQAEDLRLADLEARGCSTRGIFPARRWTQESDAYSAGYRVFKAPGRGTATSPVWVRAGQLLDDAFERSGGGAVAVEQLRELTAAAEISWASLVTASRQKGIAPRRVPGTRRSAWHLTEK